MTRHSVTTRLRKLAGDRCGAYDLIQFALILPVFVVILYGSFEIYKLISIRQSLSAGTYQAARYLSVYHKYYYDLRYNRSNADDTARAEQLVWQSLRANGFISDSTPLQLAIRYSDGAGRPISTPVDFPCPSIRDQLNQSGTASLTFTVQATASLPWQSSVLGLPLGTVTLSSRHTSLIDCGPWYPPPPPTPTPTGPGGGR
jgi:Flp pilus assembly protein TadG